MEGEILVFCDVDKGLEREGYVKHGLQKVQSILLPANLYYLECGCIYRLNIEKNKFELLRPYIQRCTKCGQNVEGLMVLKNKEGFCCLECVEKVPSAIGRYRHKDVPVLTTPYEREWKFSNDEKSRLRFHKD